MMNRLILLVLVCTLASCSRRSESQLYHEGMAAEEQKDMTTALARYGEAVEKYPATAYAESSLYRTAMIHMNAGGDKHPAVDAQLRFCTLFPQSSNAPSMLFLAAFTYNNDLHNIDSARLLYGQFLEKYPGSELATSAQFELETLGKSPDEYLRSRADTTTVTPK